MEYDYLKVKPYNERMEKNEKEKFYVLSFSDQHHVKVSETAKQIIDLFNGSRSFKEIKGRLESLNIHMTDEELKKVIKEILFDKAMLEGTEYKKKGGNTMLWLKIPLIESDKLKGIFHVLKYLFAKKMLVICMLLILFSGVCSIYKIIAEGINTGGMNSILVFLLGYLSLFFHEFGHISAAYKCNINAGKIGIGIYMISPVMYVDMTNAWRLESRKRVLIDFGGMYFQGLFTIPITAAAIITGNNMYYLGTIIILTMTLYNMIPFLKLDGYWLFCDYFKLDNVSINAFGLVKSTLKSLVSNKKSTKESLDKERKIYYIFSFIYAFSIMFMIGVGSVYTIITIRDWDHVVGMLHKILINIQTGNMMYALNDMNSILVYLIPAIFITVMIIKKLIKGIVKVKERKNG